MDAQQEKSTSRELRPKHESVRAHLDHVLGAYHRAEFLSTDPLEFVHRYKDPLEQEMVGLLSALLAYGNAKQIRKSISELLGRIESPIQFMHAFKSKPSWQDHRKRLEGFVHRFNVGQDFFVVLRLLSRTWDEHGSLGTYFNERAKDAHLGEVLSELISLWRGWAKDIRWLGTRPKKSVHCLLNSPADGSCCKRWCMYMKWMIRKDDIDIGTWSCFENLRPADLIIPVDTHIAKVSRKLGLTQRKTMNWKAALEITEALRAFNPQDPTIYDFALTRPGIMKLKGI